MFRYGVACSFADDNHAFTHAVYQLELWLYALMGTLAIVIRVTRHLDKSMYEEIKGSGSEPTAIMVLCDHVFY